MFIGHYGLSYIVKKERREIPLWLLFTSVQLLDLIAFTLVFFGVENASYAPSENPFFRNQLFLPYSHSLSGAMLISAVVFMIFWLNKNKSWAWILSLCVLSHWFIDFAVHTNDLSIFFGSINVGLGLWNYPYVAYTTEILFLLIGWLLLKKRNVVSVVLLLLLIGGFSKMLFGEEPEAMKQSASLRSLAVLISNCLFILLAYFSESKAERNRLFMKTK